MEQNPRVQDVRRITVGILKGDTVVGAGFVASKQIIFTCAHIISSIGSGPGDSVVVRLFDGTRVNARVEPQYWRTPDAEDIAVLSFEWEFNGIELIKLGASSEARGHRFRTFGLLRRDQELIASGEVIGDAVFQGTKVLLLRSRELTPDFSGSPVFDEVTRRVIGMVTISTPDKYQRLGNTAFAIPSESLLQVYPELSSAADMPTASNETEVLFTAFHPRNSEISATYKMPVYVYERQFTESIMADAKHEIRGEFDKYNKGQGSASQLIVYGTRIRIEPYLPGIQFTPLEATIEWDGGYQKVNFQMMVKANISDERIDSVTNGDIKFFVGPVCIGIIDISTTIIKSNAITSEGEYLDTNSKMFRKIFPSHSHKDLDIVYALEEAYTALGMEYLRDVQRLRSGEDWWEGLQHLIEEADIFQLCWSINSKGSKNVEDEWRYALSKNRVGFIRPIYWERPMPTPPEELEHLHFCFYNPEKKPK